MKKRILLIVCLCMALGFAGCGFVNREAQKATVFRMVEENYALLMEDISIGDFARSEAIPGIESAHVYRDAGEACFIEYSCGGHGFGSATSYFGFYYSEDDDPGRIWCAGEPLVPEGNGFRYRQEDGDNWYYTERIKDHFYYYEAGF